VTTRARLDEAAIAAGLAALPGWTRQGEAILKRYVFPTFAEGIRFVDRVAVAADAADHHPDIDIRWTSVTLTLSTHSAGGLTVLDLALAAESDRLAAG
jgi:4a-hydroxytetrahydrobiopterin dehydratase